MIFWHLALKVMILKIQKGQGQSRPWLLLYNQYIPDLP